MIHQEDKLDRNKVKMLLNLNYLDSSLLITIIYEIFD